MIWQHPWGWLGLISVALPVLIHLLGRGHARVVRFPTLRFIDASRLLPTRRSRLQDPLLLAVRVAVVALAALALAQPLLLTAGRRGALDRGLARAVIVDTSRSVRRTSIDSARAIAKRLAGEAQASIVVEANDPTAALRGAVAWVAKQQRRGEVAVVSDFQRGQLEREDLAAVAAPIGVLLRRVATVKNNDSSVIELTANGRTTTATAVVSNAGVDVNWTVGSQTLARLPVELFGGQEDAEAVKVLQSASAIVALPLPIDTTRAVAVVFARYTGRDTLALRLHPARAPWQLALLDSARREGLSIAAAGEAVLAGVRRFVLLTNASPTSLEAARLVSVARRSTTAAPTAS